MPHGLSAYIPTDRAAAISRGESLPDRAEGAVLFADISGFTPLTEALSKRLGARRGAEELARRLDDVYDSLIATVKAYGGVVIGFAGDAITCWFDARTGRAAELAASCALALQAAMQPFAVAVAEGGAGLGLKVAVASGPVRRFQVGDPDIQLFDVIAGRTVTRVTDAEHQAQRGEVWLDETTVVQLEGSCICQWHTDPVTAERYGLLDPATVPLTPDFGAAEEPEVSAEEARAWVLPSVYERVTAGHGEFITELRPAGALFLHFSGIDYDGDDFAGEKLDAFVRWVQGTLAHFGGILVQLTIGEKGSYLYAAFGAPIANDDDARRLVNAAGALRSPPELLAFLTKPAIGLSWGTMRVGAYGSRVRRTYGVLGDDTNLAARLMQAAAPGQVIASKRLVLSTVRNFAWSPLPSIVLKGKQAPAIIYQLEAGAASADARPPDSIVGREAERATLAGLVRATARGESSLAVIEGDAGLGKSRLLEEMRLRAEEAGLLVLAGGGSATERSTPYHAWQGAIARALGIENITDLEARRRGVLNALESDEWALAPLLNAVLPLEFPESPVTEFLNGPARVNSTHELIIQVLRRLSRVAPLAVMIEDAHFIDSASWTLALTLHLRTRTDRVLLVLTTRSIADPPVELGRLAESPGSVHLRLEPLGAHDAGNIAAQRMGARSLPKEVVELIQARAEGNPFFSEEVGLALLDSGLISVLDGECRIAEGVDLASITLPDTVQGLITGRIDRLEPRYQLTLKLGSVIGREFDLPTLQGIYPVPYDVQRLTMHLGALERASFVLPDHAGNEMLFSFKHALTHDVTYNLLLFSQRQALHRAIAEWLEHEYRDHLDLVVPRLAFHWTRAVEHADNPDPAQVARAINYLSRSADQASRISAFREAVAGYEQALALLDECGRPDLPERPNLLVQLGLLLEKVGNYAGSLARLGEGLDRARALDDQRTVAEALSGLCYVAFRQGRYDEAVPLGLEALEAARQAGDERAMAKALSHLGSTAAYQGDFETSMHRHEESLAISRGLGDTVGETRSLCTLGAITILAGNLTAAEERLSAALELAREIGDRQQMATALSNLGLVSEKQGDYRLAAQRYEEALGVFRIIASSQNALICTLNLADVSTALGDYGEALERYREVLAESITRNAVSLALGALRGAALVYASQGQLRKAALLLGLALRHRASDVEVRQQAEPALALVRDGLGEPELETLLSRGEAMTLEAMLREVIEPAPSGRPPTGESEMAAVVGSP